ncbi:DUF4157 domain-containing protein [Actinoplanes sp. NPDC051346]|uniref:eCIS core domain-containing protein n=1 Tax=Actinoplanes sp. NPDC051346 TaxID=3155048 RepID=UPI003449BE48
MRRGAHSPAASPDRPGQTNRHTTPPEAAAVRPVEVVSAGPRRVARPPKTSSADSRPAEAPPAASPVAAALDVPSSPTEPAPPGSASSPLAGFLIRRSETSAEPTEPAASPTPGPAVAPEPAVTFEPTVAPEPQGTPGPIAPPVEGASPPAEGASPPAEGASASVEGAAASASASAEGAQAAVEGASATAEGAAASVEAVPPSVEGVPPSVEGAATKVGSAAGSVEGAATNVGGAAGSVEGVPDELGRLASVPLVYRAVLPDLPPRLPLTPAPTPAPPAAARALPVVGFEAPVSVPTALVEGFRQRYGVDVSNVPVWSGPAATEVVRRAGARAVTRGGEILVPDSIGPLDAPRAQALLAHELAHVVQQRTLGTPPGESTAAGRDLEARALAAEFAFGGASPDDLTSSAPPVSLLDSATGGLPGNWGVTPGGGLTWRASAGAGPPAGPAIHPMQQAPQDTPIQQAPQDTPIQQAPQGTPIQRAPHDTSADTLHDLRELLQAEHGGFGPTDQRSNPASPPVHDAGSVQDVGSVSPPGAAPATAPAFLTEGQDRRLAEVRSAVERLRTELRSMADREQATLSRLDNDTKRLRSWVRDQVPDRVVSLERPEDLEELAGRLYGRLRGRLRQELLVDRERSGRLTTFR